jgi:hypothetical protein
LWTFVGDHVDVAGADVGGAAVDPVERVLDLGELGGHPFRPVDVALVLERRQMRFQTCLSR